MVMKRTIRIKTNTQITDYTGRFYTRGTFIPGITRPSEDIKITNFSRTEGLPRVV